MTSNVPPPSAASGGRRRVLGHGPGTAPGPAEAPPGAPPPAPPPAPVPPSDPAAEPRTEPPEAPREPREGAGRPRGPGTPAEPSEAPVDPVERSAARATPEEPAERPTAAEGAAGAPPASTTATKPRRRPGEPPGAPVPPRAPKAPGGTAGKAPGSGTDDAGAGDAGDSRTGGVFTVRLSNFEGPFDLLLQLISKHKLDVTEVALSKVTDEFMAHIRAMGPDWDLDRTTEFLVVAATLLDLKTARLLPAAEVEDEADLALLEARDLLFARLLQYRAYKQIADIFSTRLAEESRRYPRTVGLEAQYAELLPEVVISIGAEGLAKLAVKAMQPKPKPQVYVDHIHAPLVSVQEQAGIVVARLRELGEASFRSLVEDTDDALTVVARFLALLELYREKAVALDQEEALGDLVVRWTGGEGDEGPRVTDEFDRPAEAVKDGAGRGSEKEKA
ncbi:segregation and condensation protein A [Streptomyces triticiradicis]|uniref:Segregation and condensation protein A n=1 Tax=Streptomyces triticiradicis TaxID=2651189 RepID=A0A7J5D290_9ACTN|nr:segregation/condensation protein A [Streptomyces triticiradicis]KAB1977495.1 segregation/condensation protein A [Streptomyces triticiradicis]